MSSYSVFIPRVFSNITDTRIADIFHNEDIGKVSSVDLISKKTQKGDATIYYNMAFVHFETVYNSNASHLFREQVADPNVKAKLVYDDPWFWLVLPFEQKERPQKLPQVNNTPMVYNPELCPPPMAYNSESCPPMAPYWMMTPNGPICQWVYASPPVTQFEPQAIEPQAIAPPVQMIPPQVMYPKHKRVNQNLTPKQRINLNDLFESAKKNQVENVSLERT
jgi:hypothetical protein